MAKTVPLRKVPSFKPVMRPRRQTGDTRTLFPRPAPKPTKHR